MGNQIDINFDSIRLYLRRGISAVKTECQISVKSRIEILYSHFKPGPLSSGRRENDSDVTVSPLPIKINK